MSDENVLGPISTHELLSPEPEVQAAVSDDIDKFFNTPLDIFPYSDEKKKPKRFHVFFGDAIRERFPEDKDLQDIIARFGRRFFGSMVFYMWTKRFLLILGVVGVSALMLWGPQLAEKLGLEGTTATGAIGGGMVLVYGLLCGVNAIIFSLYRVALENRSYSLSRQIIERTRELQNLFLSTKALPDQEETRYPDGESWGARSSYLMRLLVWVGQRVEYMERYLQMEMWRLRRERYWLSWAGGIGIALILSVWGWWMSTLDGDTDFRILQGMAGVAVLILSLSSYMFWKTPVSLAREKLGAENWVRYSTLDLDNAIGDQVNRDKQRITEYRNLNKR